MQRIRLESPLSLGYDVSGGAFLGRVEGTCELVVLREMMGAAASPEVRASIQRASRIRDVRLVSTLGTFLIGEQCYLVSEFVPGLPLAQLLAPSDAWQCLSAITLTHIACEALRALHVAYQQTKEFGTSEGVHGGLTPWSVIVSTSGQVRLSGFGLGEISGPGENSSDPEAFLRWAAPERLAGHAFDQRSDVYSMGAVLWEALTLSCFDGGGAPSAGGHSSALKQEPARAEIPVPDPELLACCRRALQPNPRRRYQTVHEFLGDLDRYVRERASGREAEALASLVQIVYPGSPFDVRRLQSHAPVKSDRPEELMDIDEALDHDETTARTDLSFIARALTGPPIEKPRDAAARYSKVSAALVVAIAILVARAASLW